MKCPKAPEAGTPPGAEPSLERCPVFWGGGVNGGGAAGGILPSTFGKKKKLKKSVLGSPPDSHRKALFEMKSPARREVI